MRAGGAVQAPRAQPKLSKTRRLTSCTTALGRSSKHRAWQYRARRSASIDYPLPISLFRKPSGFTPGASRIHASVPTALALCSGAGSFLHQSRGRTLQITQPLMLGDRRDKLRNPFACRGSNPEHGRTPVSQLPQRRIRSCKISFVDNDNMSDFQQPGFHRLDLIAQTGCYDCYNGVSDINNVHFVLTDTNRLDQNDLVPGRLQYQCGIAGGLGESSMMTTSGHAPDIDPAIERMFLHPDAIAQQGSTRDGAADIDSQDPDLQTCTSICGNELSEQRALACSRITGDPDHNRLTRG